MLEVTLKARQHLLRGHEQFSLCYNLHSALCKHTKASCAAKLCMTVLTCTVIGFVASPGNFSPQLDVMACLVTGCSICSQSKHASSKTSEVSHLVLQQSALPLGDVRQAPARLSDQVGLYGLQRDMVSKQRPIWESAKDQAVLFVGWFCSLLPLLIKYNG